MNEGNQKYYVLHIGSVRSRNAFIPFACNDFVKNKELIANAAIVKSIKYSPYTEETGMYLHVPIEVIDSLTVGGRLHNEEDVRSALGLEFQGGTLRKIADLPKEEEQQKKATEKKENPKEEKVNLLEIACKGYDLYQDIKKAIDQSKPKPVTKDCGLNDLADEIHQINREKGFWDNKRNIGEMLMLVTSELGEGMEALRKDKFASIIGYHEALRNKKSPQMAFEQHIKDSFEDEIADAVIRLLDMAAGLHINLEQHVRLKLDYNRSRSRLHGKTF